MAAGHLIMAIGPYGCNKFINYSFHTLRAAFGLFFFYPKDRKEEFQYAE